MREFKAIIGLGTDNKVVSIEPIRKSESAKPVDFVKLNVRLFTDEEIDREVSECMQDGCHVYERVNHRVHQKR
jgi:hypothetical protein